MKYLFLNSYLEAREKHIANWTDFDRMINSKDKRSALEVLQNTDYGIYALESDSPEEIIRKEKESFRKDLVKMGYQHLADLYFLKEDITNLRILLKNKLLGTKTELNPLGKDERNLKKEFEEEMKEAGKIKSFALLDDHLTEIHLKRMKEHAKEDNKTNSFINEYEEVLRNSSGKAREERIREIEEDFMRSKRKENEGLAPVIAYFMQKWRAEKFIKTIISGKEAGLFPSEIKTVLHNLRIL